MFSSLRTSPIWHLPVQNRNKIMINEKITCLFTNAFELKYLDLDGMGAIYDEKG